MTTAQSRSLRQLPRSYRSHSLEPPPAELEGAYYLYLLYVNMAPDLGLVVPMAGLAMLMALAGCCLLLHRGASPGDLLKSIRLPLACAVSFAFVRLLVHGEDVSADYVREVPAWVCTLVIAQSLCLRPGFLQRFPIAMFTIGLPALRSLRLDNWGITTAAGEEVVRVAGLGPLANSNGMAFWFGLCCIHFAVLGLETRRMPLRLVAWGGAIACLFVVGMTVSRGTLLAVAISVVIAFRRLLKRGFLPLLLLLIAGGVVYSLGLFDQAVGSYSARGLEETGRVLVWPLAIERFFASPLFGVADVATYVPGMENPVTPHNSLLFIGLMSGIVPLLFFVSYCAQAAIGVWRAHRAQLPDALFVLPLLVYVFITAQTTNILFVEFPFIVTLAAAVQGANRRVAPEARRRPVRGRYVSTRAGLQMPEALR